ncbi:translation initiation factor IF-2-like [Oenanthe melanoleuca]|uniref:translation initiation factor IF-2-like n=1 Tax=Oenanthe melanoleuca TaxID=2939378 RepID=UPI0024C1BE12|nr:translation initiation factor IF-2-like [Oenanthe melanoleuca]
MRVQITKGGWGGRKERETGNNGGGEARRAAPGRRRGPGRQEEEEEAAEEEGDVVTAGRGLRWESPAAQRGTGASDHPQPPPRRPPRRAPGRPCVAATEGTGAAAILLYSQRFKAAAALSASRLPPAPPGNFFTKRGCGGSRTAPLPSPFPRSSSPSRPFAKSNHAESCMSVGVCVSAGTSGTEGPCHSGAIAHVPSRPWGRSLHPLSSAPTSFPGPPAWRRNPRKRQKFGVPPRPSPPRSTAGAEDEASGFKAHRCRPAVPGVGYLSGLQGPAGLRLSAQLEPVPAAEGPGPRRVTTPPARRGVRAPLCTPPLPRTPRFPPSPPALLQQPAPLLEAAQPCPGLAPPARGDAAGRCRGFACGWGYAPVAVGELCFALGTSRWCCSYPAQLLGARPGAAGGRRPQPGSGTGGGYPAANKVTLSKYQVCLSLALSLVYLRGLSFLMEQFVHVLCRSAEAGWTRFEPESGCTPEPSCSKTFVSCSWKDPRQPRRQNNAILQTPRFTRVSGRVYARTHSAEVGADSSEDHFPAVSALLLCSKVEPSRSSTEVI